MEGEFYCGPYCPKLDRQDDLYVQPLCLFRCSTLCLFPSQRADQYLDSLTNENFYTEHSLDF